ncbi:hypothetical protein FJZ31_42725 [Candidatus Poribacteria bacterium]|nr:hypothetical protein [Candidatus Poribacteria bacterium]
MIFSEISGSLYAWDLADEGIERILDNLQEMTACNSTYLIALMHHEKRPLTDYFYPHNPVRKTYCPEDSRAYFRPDPKFYGRIKPLTSDRDFLKSPLPSFSKGGERVDWLLVLIDAARKRGMKTGAELSHTLIDSERAQNEFPDCMQHDIYGNRLGKLICFNNPDAREYVIGLFSDLTTNYDIDYIQTCLIPFSSGRGSAHDAAQLLGTTLGGCFCDSCKKAANEVGIDFEQLKSALRPVADSIAHPTLEQSHEMALLLASNTSATAVLMEAPELLLWLVFRRDSLTRFFKDIHDRIHAIKPTIDLRLNAYISSNQELSGLDLRALKPHLDSIRSSDYSEQSGNMSSLEHKRRWLMSVRRAVGEEMHFLSAIGVRSKATPEIIRQGVVVSAQCGVDGLTMGHYDGAPFSNLRAIKEGMELADVEFVAKR